MLPMMKLASSPTISVCVAGRCPMFLINSTVIPASGPRANAASSAGISEKSNFKNAGKRGSDISRYIRARAAADRIPVFAIHMVFVLRLFTTVRAGVFSMSSSLFWFILFSGTVRLLERIAPLSPYSVFLIREYKKPR